MSCTFDDKQHRITKSWRMLSGNTSDFCVVVSNGRRDFKSEVENIITLGIRICDIYFTEKPPISLQIIVAEAVNGVTVDQPISCVTNCLAKESCSFVVI